MRPLRRRTGLLLSAGLCAALIGGCADVPLEGSPSPDSPTVSVTPDEPEPSTTLTPGTTPPAATVARTFPAKLRNGRVPLFVVVSFDGAGDLDLWSHWRSVADRVDARMTFFLSGPYLYPEARKADYKPPYRKPGSSDIGWSDPAKAVRRAAVLRQAVMDGHEIGTHANGHFCGATGIDRWSAAQWRAELASFDSMVTHGPTLAAGRLLAAPFDPATVKGMRTPCLEGNRPAYRQVMRRRGMLYDASETGRLAWPTRKDGLWNFPLESVELAGTHRDTLTMDYNLWYSQTGAREVPASKAPRLRAQVLATYRAALTTSRRTGRPPLFLGNHFNRWNHGVYADALAAFVLETCRQPDVRCVSNIELVGWLQRNGPPTE